MSSSVDLYGSPVRPSSYSCQNPSPKTPTLTPISPQIKKRPRASLEETFRRIESASKKQKIELPSQET